MSTRDDGLSAGRGVRIGVALGLALMALLAGCTTSTSSRTATSAEVGRDIVTDSDETSNARRARIRMELATGYYSRGEMKTALDEVKQAIAANPAMAEAYNLRGLIYSNLGDDALAEESFRYALRLAPRDGDSMQNYGYFLCQRKRVPEALPLFDQALALPRYPNAVRTLMTKGVCEAQGGDLAAAETSLVRASRLDPANAAVSYNLADVLFRRGDFERARFFIRKVNAIPGLQGPPTLWLAARIEQHLGNRTGMQDFGEQLRHRFPDAPETGQYERGQFDE